EVGGAVGGGDVGGEQAPPLRGPFGGAVGRCGGQGEDREPGVLRQAGAGGEDHGSRAFPVKRRVYEDQQVGVAQGGEGGPDLGEGPVVERPVGDNSQQRSALVPRGPHVCRGGTQGAVRAV